MTRLEYTDEQEASVLERSGAHDISSAISATRRSQRARAVLDPVRAAFMYVCMYVCMYLYVKRVQCLQPGVPRVL